MKKYLSKPIPALVAFLLILCTFGIKTNAAEAHILDGVYAENIPLGGYTADEAREIINRYVDELSNRLIVLYTVNDEEVSITPGDVGFRWSNPEIIDEAVSLGNSGNIVTRYKAQKDLNYTNEIYDIAFDVNEDSIRSVLVDQCTEFDCEAKDGGLKRQDDGTFVVEEGQTGSVLDVDASVKALKNFLCNEWTGENTAFQLTIKIDEPEGSSDQLALVKDVLGSFHTSFKSSGANRSANVRNGARLINGSLVYPGEEYSFYEHVRPFTTANGYEVGAAYSSGKVIDSIGGGICQVSTTLYNAVLYSELEVTSRRNHSMIVSYVDPARDATIAEASGIDFKFVNNTDAPIYIDAYTTDDKNIYVTIYGHETRPEGRTVEYESEVLSKTVPETEDIFTDPSAPAGTIEVQSAHIGYSANLWKVVTQNGETTRELVNTSTYKPVPRYATVGTATTDPNVSAMLQSAIASGSIDTVKATVSSIKSGAVVPQDPEAALAQYEAALAAMNQATGN